MVKKLRKNTLKEFHAAFAKDKLQKSTPTATTSNNWLRNQRPSLSMLTKTLLFLSLFLKANISYSEITVSFQKDSREVGYFDKSALVGEVKFRFWPLDKIGTVEGQLRTLNKIRLGRPSLIMYLGKTHARILFFRNYRAHHF